MQLKEPAGMHIQNLLITSVKISNIDNEYRGGKKLFPCDWLHKRSHASCIRTTSVRQMYHMTNVDVWGTQKKQHQHGRLTDLHQNPPPAQLSETNILLFSFSFFNEQIDFSLLDGKGFVRGLKVVTHTWVVSFHRLPSSLLGLHPRAAPVFIWIFSVISLWNLESDRKWPGSTPGLPPVHLINLVFLPAVLIQAAYPERLGEELRLNHYADDVIFFFFFFRRGNEPNLTIYLK